MGTFHGMIILLPASQLQGSQRDYPYKREQNKATNGVQILESLLWPKRVRFKKKAFFYV